MPRLLPRENRPLSGAFSLIELLAAMAVLALLVLMVTQIMNGATRTTGASRHQLDADAEARTILDRMSDDFGRMVNRQDVDFFFDKKGGNDRAFFYSAAPAISPKTGTQQPISLVGYRINSKNQLERLGKGLSWGKAPPEGLIFLTYDARNATATVNPVLDQKSTLEGGFPSIVADGSTDDAFHVLGQNVFRLEFNFLLKPYVDKAGTNQPAKYSTKPYNETLHQSGLDSTGRKVGLSDVQAIVVTFALMDGKSRALVADSAFGAVAGKLKDADDDNEPIGKTWQDEISSLSSPGVPHAAAAQIRVYQRLFYLNSGVTDL